ncbi:hypothetical protein [Aliivibrio fischeri]|uniref:hypothetical protein n=1 Tax=Aliivibrio fischeri TaxID=668 RepID=UPI00080E5254|nr:hypothetical protein [Aliivibrio fischeri]OCH01514.1 hypothetical protein A6E10_18720 [Aliivibrio fischeri]
MNFSGPNSINIDASSVTIPNVEGESGYSSQRAYTVKVPEEETREFVVEIRSSELRKASRYIDELSMTDTKNRELLLFAASICGGSWLSTLASSASVTGWYKLLFLDVFPLITIGCIVAFFFVRSSETKSVSQISRELKEILPSPENTINKGDI